MKVQSKITWIVLLSFLLILCASMKARNLEAQRGRVGTQTCIDCHRTWLDNDPSVEDVISGLASVDYLPANLSGTRTGNPFYTIPEGFLSSMHYTPTFNTAARDFVSCEDCHGRGAAHFGIGNIPTAIPQAKTCSFCHNENHPTIPFNFNDYLLTSHANRDNQPKKFFDQNRNGDRQATIFVTSSPRQKVSLFKLNQLDIVTKNERIEECSVCHNYALQYPTLRKMIAQGNIPKPQVSCGACHDSHIVGPTGNQPASVNTTVRVTGLSGTTVTAVAPADGREVFYVNNKPYKINADGAQDTINGTWTRGSAFNRPQPVVVQGIGEIKNSATGVADRFEFRGGGLLDLIQPGYTLFVSGKASATVNLPADALNAGAPITVEATLDKAGFAVGEVETEENIVIGTFDQTLILETREDPARLELIAQLGTDRIGIVAKAPVTYAKAGGQTGTINVFVPLSGEVNFEVRDMRTNTETLCMSCHTQGKLKYTAWGKKKDGTFIDLSPSHNQSVGGQYRRSGHGDMNAIPFKEFSSYEYGSSHQPVFPFDMSITGSGGLNSLRNKENTTFKLTTPSAQNAYLGNPGITTQPVLINNYACNQCHHGLGSIDYMKDRQGTPSAQVLWGDATVVCITCHETHKDPQGFGKNVRVPVKLSYNPQFADPAKNPRGGINKFMDGTDIPPEAANSNSLICLFCHQGRESGLTVYTRIKPRLDPYTNPDQVINPAGFSFVNPHYLDSGSLVWSRNAWEYFFQGVPQRYSAGNVSHQQLNCAGCHMGAANADNTEGGHTWRPRIETCQECHFNAVGQPVANFYDVPASADYDGSGQPAKTTFEEIGTLSPDGSTGTGLFGQLVAALNAKGIFYNPNSYPYFFTVAGGQFRAFTTHTLSASFNLAWAYKSGNCVYYHNAKYVVQILQDSLRALGVTPTGTRPEGDRNATDYRTIVINP